MGNFNYQDKPTVAPSLEDMAEFGDEYGSGGVPEVVVATEPAVAEEPVAE